MTQLPPYLTLSSGLISPATQAALPPVNKGFSSVLLDLEAWVTGASPVPLFKAQPGILVRPRGMLNFLFLPKCQTWLEALT